MGWHAERVSVELSAGVLQVLDVFKRFVAVKAALLSARQPVGVAEHPWVSEVRHIILADAQFIFKDHLSLGAEITFLGLQPVLEVVLGAN